MADDAKGPASVTVMVSAVAYDEVAARVLAAGLGNAQTMLPDGRVILDVHGVMLQRRPLPEAMITMLSVVPGEPGYENYLSLMRLNQYSIVMLDGVEVRNCISANMLTGTVVREMCGTDGKPLIRGGAVQTETVTGLVSFITGPRGSEPPPGSIPQESSEAKS